MKDFYPKSKPYNTDTLKLDNIHTMRYYEYGNPDGEPVVYLHGGPGGGSAPSHAQYFDPEHFRIITFDQRGCGKSIPHAETKDNTPDHLVHDINALREHLDIDEWHVAGGSWGTTLALIYAEEFPDTVKSLLLRGIFMMRDKEIDLLYKQSEHFYPDAYKAFVEYLPENLRDDPLSAYHDLLTDPDPDIHLPAAHAWCAFENAISYLKPEQQDDKSKPNEQDDLDALSCARLEAHFFVNHLFKPDNRIIQNIDNIKDIPIVIVQGRYDVVCPPTSAYELAFAHPNCKLVLTTAGHAGSEPENVHHMVEAADNIRDHDKPFMTVENKVQQFKP